MRSQDGATGVLPGAKVHPDGGFRLLLAPPFPTRQTMSRSNRGAAQVSLMWVISFAVISLGAIFFAFTMNEELTKTLNERDTALAERDGLRTTNDELRSTMTTRSDAMGFKAGDAVDVDVMNAQKEDYIREFGLDGTNLRAFSDLYTPVVATYKGVVSERARSEARLS